MAVNKLVENDQIISDLRGALRDGQSGLRYVPKLLRRVLEDEAWRQRIDSVTHAEVGFRTFADFVIAAPTEGLGADMTLIERIVGDDPELKIMLREVSRVGRGNGKRSDSERLNTDDSAYQAERLAREAPDEYAAVQRGEKSINAAAVAAGIRRRRIPVRLDSPESAAETLRKHMPVEARRRLAELLAADD